MKWLLNSGHTPPAWYMLPVNAPLFPAFMESQPWVMENQGCISRQQQAGEAQPFFFHFQQTVMGAVSYTHLDVYKRQIPYSGGQVPADRRGSGKIAVYGRQIHLKN